MSTESRSSLAVLSMTQAGRQLARKISKLYPQADLYVRVGQAEECQADFRERPFLNHKVTATLSYAFQHYDALICIMASGIVVRSLAPMLQHKYQDPAVLVVDEAGQFVVSLLSGHVGGANELARDLATAIGGQAVITTATDQKEVVGVDILAKDNRLVYRQASQKSRIFNMMLAEGEALALYNPEAWPLKDTAGFTSINHLDELLDETDFKGLVYISSKRMNLDVTCPSLHMVPKKYVLGMGCKKNHPYEKIQDALDVFTKKHEVDPLAIALIASIDLKQNEAGILQLAEDLSADVVTYSKDELLEFESLYPGSDFVKQTVGVSSVSQVAAHKASQGQVLTERFAQDGVTLCLGLLPD